MTGAEAEHHHRFPHPHGPVFEGVFAVSMLFSRGGMARAVSALAELSATDVVVDLGCGTGTAVRRARRSGAGLAVGIDPSPQMLRLAKLVSLARRMEGIRFQEGTAESIPLDSASATVVWSIQSVHHWRDRARGLEESLRVLAPGGRLILAERSVTPGARGRASHGVTEQGSTELVRLVAKAGFADAEKRIVPLARRNLVVITARAPGS
jgi:ubiquinone/menaquinone biosynthesis C-methylase UbiE